MRGAELGWFQHGSTLILPRGPGLALVPGLVEGEMVRVGQALLRRGS